MSLETVRVIYFFTISGRLPYFKVQILSLLRLSAKCGRSSEIYLSLGKGLYPLLSGMCKMQITRQKLGRENITVTTFSKLTDYSGLTPGI